MLKALWAKANIVLPQNEKKRDKKKHKSQSCSYFYMTQCLQIYFLNKFVIFLNNYFKHLNIFNAGI